MADEIRVVGALTANKATAMANAMTFAPAEQLIDMSGLTSAALTIAVGTSAEALPLGEITSLGWAFFYNLHASGTISIRNGASGADVISLKAGEWCIVRLKSDATPYAVGSTTSMTLQYAILSD